MDPGDSVDEPRDAGREHPGLAHEPVASGVLASVRDSIEAVAGTSLVGLYLYGSVVAGGYHDGVSDIDLIAVLSEDPTDELVDALGAMHDSLDRRHPEWVGRVEVVYVAAARLQRPHDDMPRVAVISPGEPFHLITAGPEWVLTWYPAREEALALIGPPISTVIPDTPRDAFLSAVRRRLEELGTGPNDDDPVGSCAYVVFTVCRALYTLEFGSRPTKVRAGEWMAQEFPVWALLIQSAMSWRRHRWTAPDPDPSAIAETREFVRVMTAKDDSQV